MKKYMICFLSLLLTLVMCACSTSLSINESEDVGEQTESSEASVEESAAFSSEETSEEDTKKLKLKFSGLPYSSIVYTADIATLNESNPWNEDMQLTEMPVIEKRSILNKYQMQKTLSDFARGMNLTEMTDPVDLEDSFIATYEEGVVISVNSYGHIQILYANGGMSLPDGYSFDASSRDAAIERLSWLTENYAGLFGIDEAVQCVEPYYNEKGELSYSTYSLTGAFSNTFIYSKGESAKEDILNRFLYPVRFAESVYEYIPRGTLGGIYAYLPIESSLVNEYPIISIEEAKALLLEKKCYCPGTLNLDMLIKEEAICKAELVYNNDAEGGTCMPFYCFWLKAPDEEYAYYSCYVPAVEERYLDTSSFPNWN